MSTKKKDVRTVWGGEYLRFRGMLSTNGNFTLRYGHQTDLPARPREQGKRGYVLELLDGAGRVIDRVFPVVEFITGCSPATENPRPDRNDVDVVAPEEKPRLDPTDDGIATVDEQLRYAESARRIVLRQYDEEIFSTQLAKAPPQIELSRVNLGEKGAELSWEAEAGGEGPLPLHYRVAYVPEGEGRRFLLVNNHRAQRVRVDFSTVPTGGKARLAVLATDGLLSSFTVTEPFATEAKPPELTILQPTEGEVLPPDQPLRIIASVVDGGGSPLPRRYERWTLNKEPLEITEAGLPVTDPLPPGSYHLRLDYREEGRPAASRTVKFTVAERNAAQQRLRALLERVGEDR